MFGLDHRHERHGQGGSSYHDRRAQRGGFVRGGFSEGFGLGGGDDRGFAGHRSGRGGGRRRIFEGAELRLVLLELIADQPRHGYDLIKAMEELSRGVYAPSPGVIYPTLTMLQDMGQIAEQAAEGTKRLFAITDTGIAEVEANAEQIATLTARLQALGEEREGQDRSPVRRAMMNLALVLRSRMSRSDADLAHDIAAILDETAQRIERI